MIAKLNKASAIEGLGKTHGLFVSIVKLRQSSINLLLILEPLTRAPDGFWNERSPLVDGRPCLGEDGTMVRHDAGARIKVPCGFPSPPTRVPCKDLATLLHQLYATIGNRSCKRSKDHHQRARGSSATFALLLYYDPRQFSSLFLSAAKR
jgi:hypothetical protein